jgi:hypothetical protein
VPIRRLSKQEIDQRIELLVSEVAGTSRKVNGADRAGEDLWPRWISARELVRRMHPFLVNN